MAAPHTWRECRPAILDSRDAVLSDSAAMARIVAEVFASLSDDERIAFHQFCCHNRHGAEQILVMEKFAALLRARGLG